MNSAAPTVVALETNSAWIIILAVSVVVFPVVLLLRRLIDRPGGMASGVLFTLPLVLPVIVGVAFHHAVLPEVAILRPVGESLVSGAGKELFNLLVFTDEAGQIVMPYALWGSPGPYLFLIGISVSSFMLLRRLAGAVSMRSLVRRCRPIAETGNGHVAAIVERLCAEASLRDTPEVLLLPPGPAGAFVAAGRRYRLLISEDIVEALGDDELEGLLAHEIAHVEAHDLPVVVISGLLRDVVAWNPIGHIAFRKLAVEREFEADRRAAVLTRKPLSVASGLLRVYELSRDRRPLGAAIPFVRRKTRVVRRVHRLLAIADGTAALRRTRCTPYLLAAVLVATLGMSVGACVGGQTDSAFAIVVGGPEISTADVWKANATAPRRKHRTKPSDEGRSKRFEAQKQPLSIQDPRLTENVAMSLQDVPRWVKTMTRMAGRAGVPRGAVRAEFQRSWRAVPVGPSPIGGRLSFYRMDYDLPDDVSLVDAGQRR